MADETNGSGGGADGNKPAKPVQQLKRKPPPTKDEAAKAQLARMAEVKGLGVKTAGLLIEAGIPDYETLADLTDGGLRALTQAGGIKAKAAAAIERGDLIAKAKAWSAPRPAQPRRR